MTTTAELGQYWDGILSWRKIVAAAPDDTRLKVFTNAVQDVASYVTRGLDRATAADTLYDIAQANGFAEEQDAVQGIIARAFEKIEEAERVPNEIEQQHTNGKEKQAPSLLPLLNIRAWQGLEPKPRQWIVRERIPDHNVTLLTGQGGVGKTLLMQQLSVATVLGHEWIGELPEPGPVLFISAEDDEDEMHFRYSKIAKINDTNFDQLADAGLNLLSLAGKDCAMAVADARGIVRATELFHTMVRTVREIQPRWIGLDTAADIFVVNERDRSQVRQCISLLRGICLEFDTAVILLAHPSLSGISSGSGLSGSTAWHNSVRSRMYLKTEKAKKNGEDEDSDEEPDAGTVRTLEFMKSNYSALALPVRLVWRDGLLVHEPTLASLPPIDRVALEERAKTIFLGLLDRFNRQDRAVTFKERANNFAPKEFADQPEAKELHESRKQRKRLLRIAMDQLFAREQIYTGRGPKSISPSRQTECIYHGGTLL